MTGGFKLVLRHWLNIAHAFFEQNGMTQELSHTKSLAMQVISNEVNIRDIWTRIKESKGNMSSSLGMFKEVLEEPTLNFEEFLDLADALCGKKYYPYSGEVLKILLKKNP